MSSISTRLSSATLYRLEQIWRWLLHAGFLLLCLRFLVAATRETYPDVLPVLVLTVGGLGLSAWRPRLVLFAFTVAVPLLNGLGYVGLAGLPVPASLVFSGVFVGSILRQIAFWAKGEKRKAESEKHEAESGATDSGSCRATEAEGEKRKAESEKQEAKGGATETVDLESNSKPKTQNPKLGPARLATDVLITAVLASLIVQIVRHQDSPELWKVFWNRSGFGFGDPFYFMTSAFLWLQGLFFFRMLSAKGTEHRAERKGPNTESKELSAGGGAVATWIKPAFAVYGVTLAVFFLLQVSFHVPEYYLGHALSWWVYFSPYEDISSFGSIAVSVFAFVVASQYKTSWPKMVFRYLWIIGLLALVVASWSRGAWLAGGLILLLVTWIRLSKRWIAALVGLGTIVVIILSVNTNRDSWYQNPYLWRLITLVRVENLTNKSPDRFNLYYKTVGMIRDHPFVGHGIGSIYLTSVRFARPGDPYADRPDFAHNVFLQVAAELGVPAAALFAALIIFALWKGFRKWKAEGEKWKVEGEKRKAESGSHDGRTVKLSNGQPVDGSTVGRYHGNYGRTGRQSDGQPVEDSTVGRYHGTTEDGLTILGVTMALTAYLLTQMTANSLNVYVSNQFFFWFLMAGALCANPKSEVESLKSKVEI